MKKLSFVSAVLLGVTTALCSAQAAEHLIVYSALDTVDTATKAFTAKTGIPVDLVRLSTGELLGKVAAEGNNPKFDVLWVEGSAVMHRLADQNILKPEPGLADKADFVQVMAVTDPQKGARGGISCLLVDMDMPGVRIASRQQTMMGEQPCEIVFENVEVPLETLVGAEGEGFRLAQTWINHGRIRHGAKSCGLASRCIELAASYALQRKTFGAPLADRQGIQWMIADSYTETHAARLMVYQAAAKLDRGEDARSEAYMVKIFGDEMGFRAADRCLQIFGGMGLTTELPVERFWRDQRSFIITEGPSEVLRNALAAQIFRQFR